MTALLRADTAGPGEAPRTFLPPQRAEESKPLPRTSLGVLPLPNRFLSWGARLAALALAWVIVYRLLPIEGLGWFLVVAALCNALLLAVGTLTIDSPVA